MLLKSEFQFLNGAIVFILECLTPSFRRSDPYVDKYGISWVLR